MTLEEIKNEAKRFKPGSTGELRDKINELKGLGAGLLGCVAFIQAHLDLPLNEARKYLLELEAEEQPITGEETVILLDWEHEWDKGAPMPHIVSNGIRLFLVYYLAKNDPGWDGTYVHVVNPASGDKTGVALVEFRHVVSYRFGTPNDEVIHGHPLYGKGLEAYKAHEVIRSSWIAENEKINSVHFCYNPGYWRSLKHYILTFHDDTFECIAQGYDTEIFHGAFKDVVSEAMERLFA